MKFRWGLFFIGIVFCCVSTSNYNSDLEKERIAHPEITILDYNQYYGSYIGTSLILIAFFMMMKKDINKS
jgi:hypothetical protein